MLIKIQLFKYTGCTLYLCALLSVLSSLSVLSASVVHASLPCADLISSSSTPSPSFSFSSSKEQSTPTDFGFGSEPASSGKSVLPLSSFSSKNSPEFSSNNILGFYANSKPPKEGTKSFQSYIGELLEKQIIKEPQFNRFIESLEKGELINPISQDEALTSTALLVQRNGLQKYLDQSSLDQKELLDWSRVTLAKRARVRVKREETQEETRYQRLEFYPVKRPARFEVGYGENKVRVTLTHPIEVQSTPVTQKQWLEVMGENPSRFKNGENSVVWTFHGKDIKLQPDNPVEKVTFWSVLVFANRLSEKHGIPPAYDLSEIEWVSKTRPENGTLRPVEEQDPRDLDDKIRVYVKGKSRAPYEGAYKGDVYYQTEGYRLPTHAEQIYMLQGGGKVKVDSFFENEADLQRHAWYKSNADGRTHPVGTLQPIVIDGKGFDDIYGNVNEWGWDFKDYKFELRSGKNPVGPEIGYGDYKIMRGGSWRHTDQTLPYTYYLSISRKRFDDLGLRLVRTIKKDNSE